MEEIISAIGSGVAGVIGVVFAGVIGVVTAWFTKKQNELEKQSCVRKAVRAIEKMSKSDPELRGKVKYEKACEFAVALFEEKGLQVPATLEIRIHAELEEIEEGSK